MVDGVTKFQFCVNSAYGIETGASMLAQWEVVAPAHHSRLRVHLSQWTILTNS